MSQPSIEADVLAVIDECKGLGVPARELDDMSALAKAGEPGVALENLCTQLFEYDVMVPQSVTASLRTLGQAMGVDDKYWCRLQAAQS